MSSGIDIRLVVVGMLEGNCYLLRCDDKGHGVIIDPGDEPERIAAEMEAMELHPKAILLTHGHIDHTNAAGALREQFGCPVYCHSADRQMVEGGQAAAFWGLQRYPCTVDREVADGDRIGVGGNRIGVLHAPGHTGGSVCYMVGSLLFSGDVLFRGSIGRTDLPGGSDREMLQTLKTRIAVLDSGTLVYPGHGPETTIEHEKMFNPFL